MSPQRHGDFSLSKKATGRKNNINSEKELQVTDSFFLFIQNTVGPCVERFLLSASCASYRIHIRLQRRTPCPCSLSDSLRACQKHSFLTRSASAVCAAEAFCLPSAAALTRSAFLFDTGGVSGAYADREKREEGERIYGGVSAGGTVFYGG